MAGIDYTDDAVIRSEGNNGTSLRRVFTTCNNYTDDDVRRYTELVNKFPKSGFCYEIAPTTGTPHLHGYFSFTNARRFKDIQILLNKRSDIQKCIGTAEQNYAYLTKPESKDPTKEPYLGSQMKKPKIVQEIKVLNELQFYPWQEKLAKEIKEPPNDRTVLWYWCEKGGSGKTQFCKWLIVQRKLV